VKLLTLARGSGTSVKGTRRTVFQRFGKSLESERYAVYMARPDLSTPK